MQKRIIATLLALSLCCSSVFAAENTETAADTEADAPQTAAEASVEEEEQSGEAVPAEETEEETAAEEPAPQPDPEGTLSYANLERRMRENNATMKALEETIASVEVLDYDKMKENLRDSLNSIGKGMWFMSAMGVDNTSLSSSYSSLKDTFDDLKEGKLQEDNEGIIRQLKNAQDQMVMAAESLYVSLLEMGNSRTNLQRSLDALDRTVAEMELRYQRGQISALQLQEVRDGRTQLKSGLDTLSTNIVVYTAQLENLVGLSPSGKLKLTEVPEITAEQVAAMSYEKDLEAAREKSYTLYDAAQTLEDAKEDLHDAGKQYGFNEKRYEYVSAQHTYQAAQYTYQATVDSFELGFHSAYTVVADYQQVLKAAESALALQKNTYASVETKYRQGNISKNTLLDAQDDLAEAEAAVVTAKHNLFTAYRTYWWAVEHGVLN
nr:TolC family protein [uncultured Oscillibacter sp.]